MHFFKKFLRAASLYANVALSKIDSQSVNENDFIFLRTLLQKPELSVNDVTIIATSLFIDGLSTVNFTTSAVWLKSRFRPPTLKEKYVRWFIFPLIYKTVPTLMSNLYALATNEQVQNQVYEEICAVEASTENLKKDPNWTSKLTYLKAVIKETFRWAVRNMVYKKICYNR